MSSPALHKDDNAAVGAVVAAFGCLEHELFRAVIGLYGGPEAVMNDKDLNSRLEGFLDKGHTLANRLEFFIAAAREHKIPDTWCDDFLGKIREGCRWRNMFVHGQWCRLSDGRLQVTFYGKGCIKTGGPDIAIFTHTQLHDMARITFENAKLLADHFHDKNQEPDSSIEKPNC